MSDYEWTAKQIENLSVANAEQARKITALEARLKEAEAVINSRQTLVLKMYEVYDDPQYLAAFSLLHDHQGEYTGAKWTTEQDDFTARAAEFLKGAA